MRRARIRGTGPLSVHHCISRITGQQWALEEDSVREQLWRIIQAACTFCGIRLITFCIMSNHYHLLVEIDTDQTVDGPELMRRLAALYGPKKLKEIQGQWERWGEQGSHAAVEADQARYRRRMHDVSEFMKTVNQRFTQWYNHRTGRRGVLWEGRFKNLLVENDEFALSTMAAYIDLNPVRAGIVKDPKDYRWCGYGQAVGGNATCRQGLCILLHSMGSPSCDWEEVHRSYRTHLFDSGRTRRNEAGQVVKLGFSAEAVQQVLDAGGELTREELLRCRVRYFTDGLALGSKVFLEDVFQRNRHAFGSKRKSGARPMRQAGFDGQLATLRDLRHNPILVPK